MIPRPVEERGSGIRAVVVEAPLQDVDLWRAGLSGSDLERLKILPGQTVKVTGQRSTVLKAWTAPEGTDDGFVCLDASGRQNAGVAIGEPVAIEKHSVSPARAVVLTLAGRSEDHVAGFEEPERLARLLQGVPVGAGDTINPRVFGSRSLSFRVIGTSPAGFVLVGDETRVEVLPPDAEESTRFRSAYEDIGGLEDQVRRIREMIEVPVRYPALFSRLGVQPPKGLLLYGPPGSGKTLIARALASETKAHFIHVDGPEIMHKYYGESEARLREVFEEAARNAPSIIFLDELDAVAPKRSVVAGEVEKRVVAQLLALMDGMVARGQVIVIGATNMPELLDPAVRRPGRFDREIYIGVPDARGRLDILRIHTRDMPLDGDVDLPALADLATGFVGADIQMWCKEAAINAVRRLLPGIQRLGPGAAIPPDLDVRIEMKDFIEAFREIEPAAGRAVSVERATGGLDQVAGLENLKGELKFLVERASSPRAASSERAGAGSRRLPWTVLLHGPPGTGKTLLARSLAGELRLNFVEVVPSLLFSRWLGESEKTLNEIFKAAKHSAPCIVLLDQLDALTPVRSAGQDSQIGGRLVAQVLRELRILENIRGLVVFGTTNRLDLVDPAVLARFDLVLEVPLPDAHERLRMLKMFTADLELETDVDLEAIVRPTEGLAPSRLQALCRRAYLLALREGGGGKGRVRGRHFEEAMK